MQKQLTEACGADVSMRPVKPYGAAGSPPVRLFNPAPIQPFQSLLALLPLPKYGSIDPTSYVAMFFPPIFGLMLGDIGYGLILGLITIWL
ncbi:V-type ATPase 116kDa subunit family protein [Planctomycetota bacterium]